MAHPHKSEAKSSHDRKLSGYKGGPDGSNFSDKGTFSGGPSPDDMSKKKGTDETAKIHAMGDVKAYACGGAATKRLDRTPRASGGRVKPKSPTINIVIGQPPALTPAMPPEMPEPRSGPVIPPPPMMPPGGPMPPGAGPMPMPVPRASGGRVHKDISVPAPRKSADGKIGLDGGALGGVARRQKIELQAKK